MRASKILWDMQYLNFWTLEIIIYQSFYQLGEFVSKVGFKLSIYGSDHWIMGAPFVSATRTTYTKLKVGPYWSVIILSIGRRKRIYMITFSFFRHFSLLQIEVIAGGHLFKQRLMQVHVARARAECGLDCDHWPAWRKFARLERIGMFEFRPRMKPHTIKSEN